jgi:biopolymer transport protein ExbB
MGVLEHVAAGVMTLAQAEPQDGGGGGGTSLLTYIHAGGFIGYVIILISIVALGLVIAHFIEIRAARLAPFDVREDLARLLKENDLDGAVRYCSAPDNRCFLTRVMGAGLTRATRSSFGLLELRTALQEAGSREVELLHRRVDWLSLIAAVCPMLGLLGTVIGLIGAFSSLGAAEGVLRSKELAGFMSLALVTTAQGLFVAIPSHAAASIFRKRVDIAVGEVGEMVDALASIVEQKGSGAERKPAAKATPSRAAAPGQVPTP